ncbi:MAG: histidinol-phosphate transaminase [Kiritimatiellae bacterium]|nr:histidinol-phosphate transaminase [Kiritimatiellia bacterium]
MKNEERRSPLDRAWVHKLGVYEPGLPIEEVARELGLETADDIIKLASNENVLGPSPVAVKAMIAAARQMHLYPDGGAYYLRRALARRLGVDMDEIMVGNGSNELIVFLSHVFLEPGSRIVMADRAFVIYKLVAQAYQAEATMVPMAAFAHDLPAMLKAITPDTRIVYISNPNNPTGTMVSQEDLDHFMDQVPNHVVVVFDEAYIEILPPAVQTDSLKYVREGRNVCVLRTFSKTYGLAGLRVGYAVAPRDYIAVLNRVRQPFNVNAMGLAAATAALDDEEHVEKTRRLVQDGLAFLEKALGEAGLEYVPSVTNFMLVKVGPGRRVFEALQRKKIIVRPMDGYGLPEYVRVTVGTRDHNEALMKALSAVLKEMEGSAK